MPAMTSDPRRWTALALLCAVWFMLIIDSQIVLLALPDIERALGFSPGGAQWVMSAYLVSFGGLLMLGGRIADLVGRRRMLLVGLVLFGLASLLCGLAWSGPALVVARVAQGVSAALLAPTALSLVLHTFDDAAERNRALGIWSGVGAFGATAALLIGGPITDGLGWEWIFLVNVPVAAVSIVLAPRLLRESRDTVSRRAFDPAGAVTITAAAVTLVYAIVEAPEVGWGNVQTIALLAASVLLTVGFVMSERRAAAPLVPLGIFRSSTFVSGNVLMLLTGIVVFGGALLMSLYAQGVLGFTAVAFGFGSAVYSVGSVVGSNVGGGLVTRLGFRPLAVAGMALMTLGLLLLSRISADGSYVADLLPGLIVFGYGIGTTFVAASVGALAEVPEHQSGLASGVNNATFQIGGAFGVAIATSVALANSEGATPELALTQGYRAAFLAMAAVAALGFVTALAMSLRGAVRAPDISSPEMR
jgi:EmrB/QacA subfamily drug resistance transporter